MEIFENNNLNNEIISNEASSEEAVTKEPEMFEEQEKDEDFEIPAFLRRQKN